MKKLIFTFFLIQYSCFLKAQQFNFPLYFEDAIGNKDTVTVGYDHLRATDSVDVLLGEINIVGQPRNSTFDVRVSENEFRRIPFPLKEGVFQTKKQIVKNGCENDRSSVSIEILSKHWPITARWDSALFKSGCAARTLFTAQHPNCWWDVKCGPSSLYKAWLSKETEVNFTANHNEDFVGHSAYTVQNDTISVFWLVFNVDMITDLEDRSLVGLVHLYPNPSTGKVFIGNANLQTQIASVQIIDANGKEHNVGYKENEIDLAPFSKGLYLLLVTFENGQRLSEKILRE